MMRSFKGHGKHLCIVCHMIVVTKNVILSMYCEDNKPVKVGMYGTTDPSSLPATKKRRHQVLRSPTYSEHGLTLEQLPRQTTEMERAVMSNMGKI